MTDSLTARSAEASTSCAGLLLEALQVGETMVRMAQERAALVAKVRGSVIAHLRTGGHLAGRGERRAEG